MKKYLVTGEAIDKLFQEERIRRERGEISFTLLPEEFELPEDTKETEIVDTKVVPVDDSKDVQEADSKKAAPKQTKRSKKSE